MLIWANRVQRTFWAGVFMFTLSVSAQFTGQIGGMLTPEKSNWGPGLITLTESVTLPAQMTLTINEGTTIQGPFGINSMGGKLLISGSVHKPVRFINGWIYLNGGTHNFKYFQMTTKGDHAIDVHDAELVAQHLLLQSFSTTGILVRGSKGRVDLDFVTVGSALKLFTGDNTALEGVALKINADAAQNKSKISNSVLGFLHNKSNTGIFLAGSSSNHTLVYSYIAGTGIKINTSDTTGLYYGDPKITDIPNLNHNLDQGSPALDLADPKADYALEPQPNGGRANPGYHGATALARPVSISLIYPNGCEPMAAGGSDTIFWSASRYAGTKTLWLSVDEGKTWKEWKKINDDQGFLVVTWPVESTNQAMVKISLDKDPTLFDISNKPFRIGTAPQASSCQAEPRCPGGGKGCKPFRVICYTGYRAGQFPGGPEPTYNQVREDLVILSSYTQGIRTYGSDPAMHNGGFVPKLVDSLGLDLHLGIWLDQSYSEEVNQAAISNGIKLMLEYKRIIKSVLVGNEFLLRVRQSFGDVEAAEKKLIGYLKQVKAKAPPEIAIMTGESYPDWLTASPELFAAVDRVAWHIHPWWEQKPAKLGVHHLENIHQALQSRLILFNQHKSTVLAETGYPTGVCSSPYSCGSEANQARYLYDVHAYSLRSGLEYWFFEGFDEPWKSVEGEVGDKWALWNLNRTPKQAITQIDSLIPAVARWPQDFKVKIAPSPQKSTSDWANLLSLKTLTKIEIYDVRGKLIYTALPGQFSQTFLASKIGEGRLGFLRFYAGNKILGQYKLVKSR